MNGLIATEPHFLETYTPEVTSAYVQSRLEAVAIVYREGLEDPLDDMGLIQQQLEQISVIMRMDYAKTCSLLISLFEQSAQSFQELISNPIATAGDLAIQEGNLSSFSLKFIHVYCFCVFLVMPSWRIYSIRFYFIFFHK